MDDSDTTMGEPASSPTLAALGRSKRKAADELRGPVSKRPTIEHENGTREEPTPSPTSVPLRRSKRKIPQRPVFKRPLIYSGADDQQTETNNASGSRAPKKSARKRKAAPKARAPPQNNNAVTQAPAAADDDRPTRASAPRKRGRTPNNDDSNRDQSRPRKRGQAQGPPPEPPERVVINEAPTQVLDLFVWGTGNHGELGLGSTRTYCRECKEPRRNFNMSGNGPGIVHIAAGSFHGAALTKDNRILTWGQSERGQLGRESAWEGPPAQSGLNPREANGLPVSPDNFPPNTIFTQLACGEGTAFALTNTGDVYGWGSFRIFEREEVADGEYIETDLHRQFSEGVAIQHRPVKIPGVKEIKKIVCGENHVLALDTKGELYVWGFGDYGQLGYRWSTRVPSYRCLTPSKFRLRKHKFANIGSGSFHSFAIQEDGTVWGWGSNLYGEAGQESGRLDKIGDGFSIPAVPRAIPAFDIEGDYVTDITGGEHYSMARTKMGDCLVWGLGQNGQLAFDMTRIDPDRNAVIIDPVDDQPAGLAAPSAVNRFIGKDPPDVGIVATGRFHSMAITEAGQLFRWGNNAGWQCGVEKREDDPVEEQNNVFSPVPILGAFHYYQRSWLYAGGGHGYSIAAHATDEFLPGVARTPGKNGRSGLSPVGEKLPWYLSMPTPRT